MYNPMVELLLAIALNLSIAYSIRWCGFNIMDMLLYLAREAYVEWIALDWSLHDFPCMAWRELAWRLVNDGLISVALS